MQNLKSQNMTAIVDSHKELDLIQDVIKRMADNSFKVKAWMMAIAGGVVALSEGVLFVKTGKHLNEPAAFGISIFLILLIIVFWYLDGFFLKTEKLYISVYKWVVENRKDTDEYLYDLNIFKRKVDSKETDLLVEIPSVFCVMFSKTLLPFYLLPFLFVVGLMIYNLL